MEPPRKRTCICPCPACNGKERDLRTVQRHTSIFNTSNLISNPWPDSSSHLTSSSHPTDNPHGSSSHPSDIPHCGSSHPSDNSHGSSLYPSDNPHGSSSNLTISSHLTDNHHDNSYLTNNPHDNTFTANSCVTDPTIDFVLHEVFIKLTHGSSRVELEEHLKNASRLISTDKRIPSSWSEVIAVMKKLGYQPPKHYKVCVNELHSFLLESISKHPRCPICQTSWSKCIDYYVLGLDFENWFSSQKCKQLMAHWDDKTSWFNLPEEAASESLTELWHGTRFQELSYFWDSSKSYLLPDKCTFCFSIISASQISQALSPDVSDNTSEQVSIVCGTCHSSVKISPRYVIGDPRNQAVMIHEDGWASHSTSSRHSIAAITITHACMSKLERSSSQNALVYSFVPVDQLPRDCPHKMDAFLLPLFQELEDLYIDGQEVFFSAEVAGHSPANDIACLRVIPLLATADSKAHAEIGLTASGGRKGCRRCNVTGEYLPEKHHYYYGNMQYRYKDPPSPRNAATNRCYGKEADSAPSNAQRKQLVKQNGVTGESLFYRLYDLCGFDPIYDLVIDVMHAIELNLIKSEVELMLSEPGLNQDRPVHTRSPKYGGVLRREDLDKALGQVQWTTELRAGRLPSIPSSYNSHNKHHLGNWKSEEFGKLALVAPYVLHSIVPQEVYDCFILLCQIHKAVYNKQRRIEGWTIGDVTHLKKLLWSHAIHFEHLYGTAACTENVEYSLHIPDDILRHSSPDNYWCYMYERQVCFYKRQTTNQKQLCKTFSDRAAQLRFISNYFQLNERSKDSTVPLPVSEPTLLISKTIDLAYQLKDQISSQLSLPGPIQKQYKNGIVVGSPKYINLSNRQLRDIEHWVSQESPVICEMPNSAYSFKKIVKSDTLDFATTYRKGDYIILRDSDFSDREWVMQITDFIVYGPVCNQYHLFIDGNYFVAKSRRGMIEMDEWTNQPQMVPRNFERLCVQPMSLILRKVMLYPQPQKSSHLVIDPNLPTSSSQPIVPYYPECGEVVKLANSKVLLVRAIDMVKRKVYGSELKSIQGSNPRFCIHGQNIHTFDLVCVVYKISVRRSGNAYYKM